MDLIPFYSRFVATLAPFLDDVVPTLLEVLLKDLRFQIRKKDQLHIHTKLKNIRLLGELSQGRGEGEGGGREGGKRRRRDGVEERGEREGEVGK